MKLSPKLSLPDGIFAQHIAVLGKTRSGKSSVLRLFVEGLLERGERVCIIDPKGDWWGLKSSATGKRDGYPLVIFGGQRGDVPLNAHAGASVAELVASGNRPCLIDLGGWTVADRTRLFIDFAQALFKNIVPTLHLVIDEVHNFAPQGKVLDHQSGMMLHWANRLASEGAGKGVTIYSASQRPQKVHKDFLTCAETLVAMRVIHPLDRNAIKEWLDGAGDSKLVSDLLGSLASMKRGEGWLWSPEAEVGPKQIAFPLFSTYDSFAPQAAKTADTLKGWASVDLAEVTAKLSAVVEEAKANDPKELRARIADLEKQLYKSAKSVQVDQVAIDRAVARAIGEERQQHVKAINEHQRIIDLLKGRMGKAEHKAGELASLLHLNGEAEPAQISPPKSPQPTAPKQVARQPAKTSTKYTPDYSSDIADWFRPAHQRLLNAIAWLETMGIQRPQRSIVAAVAGVSPRSSSFANDVSRLNTGGLLCYPWQGALDLTEEGRAISEHPPGAGTIADLHQAWRDSPVLRPAHVRLLDALIESYPEALSREELAGIVGVSANSSSFANDVSRLSSLGLAEYPQPGFVMAGAELLFP